MVGATVAAAVISGFGLLLWGASRRGGRFDGSAFLDEDPDAPPPEERGPRWADSEPATAPSAADGEP